MGVFLSGALRCLHSHPPSPYYSLLGFRVLKNPLVLLFFFSWCLFLRAPRVGNVLRVSLKLLVTLETQGWIPRVGDALCASERLLVTFSAQGWIPRVGDAYTYTEHGFRAPGMDLELQAWS